MSRHASRTSTDSTSSDAVDARTTADGTTTGTDSTSGTTATGTTATTTTGTTGTTTGTEPRPVNHTTTERVYDDGAARDKFGGMNWGACFFGWLVAIALSILLTSIAGAIVAAVSNSTDVTQTDAQRQAGTIGVAAAIVLIVVLAIGYWAGGYVAGRMSRFDGGRQGVGVWVIGLVVTLIAIALGAIFGSQYNILNRVSLPNLPITTDQLGMGAVLTAVVVLVLTLLAALLGGKVGHRYHDRVDRATTSETREVERSA